MDAMACDKVVCQWPYSEELKTEVMAVCDALGATVPNAAMARGINANVVHRSGRLAGEVPQGTVAKPREFVASAQHAACAVPCLPRLRHPVAPRRDDNEGNLP